MANFNGRSDNTDVIRLEPRLMKFRYTILALLIVTAVVAAMVGARQWLVERESRRNITAVETCRDWVLQNLDIGNNSIDDYQIAVDKLTADDGQPYRFIQFAHKIEMKGLIHEYIGIESCEGGFPFYFSVDVSNDGARVLDHYAADE